MSDEKNLAPCDLVMKGGVASGVVYPYAITELAETFQFRGIGGTSAGAIAASVAAAAEYRRQGNGSNAGFDKLNSLPNEFAEEENGVTGLSRLFVAQDSTAELFRLAKLATQGTSKTTLLVNGLLILAPAWLWLLTGLFTALTACSVFLATTGQFPAMLLAASVAATFALVLFTLAWIYFRGRGLYRGYLDNDYGLLKGFEKGRAGQLIDWLYNTIQEAAGLQTTEPLTFAHLEGQPDYSEVIRKAQIKCLDPKKSVKLRMITTCMTHGRPYTFPLIPNTFYFDEEKMAEYFPQQVVEWMKTHGEMHKPDGFLLADGKIAAPCFVDSSADGSGEPKPVFFRYDEKEGSLYKTVADRALEQTASEKRYWKLPKDGLLPVIVSVRLSLSVPFLFSAPTLFSKDHTRTFSIDGRTYKVAERVRFTDGGVSSNMPVHFFDSLLPKWPTLAINLTGFAPGKDTVKPEDGISFARDNRAMASAERWYRFEGGMGSKRNLPGLVMAVFDSARNWADTVQLRMPGLRDRLVDLRLNDKQGGFNLDMEPKTIKEIAERGRLAGQNLKERFGPGSKPVNGVITTWANHRWIRYRSTMHLLSTHLKACGELLSSEDYSQFLNQDTDLPGYPFQDGELETAWNGELKEPENGGGVDPEGLEQAATATTQFIESIESWNASIFARPNLPSPIPNLRPTREI